MVNYIVNKNIGTDEETGLEIELRVKLLTIDPEQQRITARFDKVLVSPTGVEVKVLESKYLERYNSETVKRYDLLDASAIGQGIKSMLMLELESYPDIEQK